MKKLVKPIAVLMSIIVSLGIFCSCSDTSDAMKKLAKKNDCVIYDDLDDVIDDLKKAKKDIPDMIDDGIYFHAEGEELEGMLDDIGVDGDEYTSLSFYMKSLNLDKVKDKDDLDKLNFCYAMNMVFTKEKDAISYFDKLYDDFEDGIYEWLDVDIDELDENEFFYNKDKAKGWINLNLNMEDIDIDKMEYLSDLRHLILSIKLDGSSITYTISIGDEFISDMDKVSSSTVGKAPSKITTNSELVDGINDIPKKVKSKAFGGIKSFLEGLGGEGEKNFDIGSILSPDADISGLVGKFSET